MALSIVDKSPMQILNELCAKCKAKSTTLTTECEEGFQGTSLPQFQSTCTFMDNDGTSFVTVATGKRKKEAEQNACEKMLRERLGIPLGTAETVLALTVKAHTSPQQHQPKVIAQTGSNPKKIENALDQTDLILSKVVDPVLVLDDDKIVYEANKMDNKIETLLRFCTKQGLNGPIYTEDPIKIVPPNTPVLVVRCKVDDIEEMGVYKQKKISKKIAAYKVLKKLRSRFSGNLDISGTTGIASASTSEVKMLLEETVQPEKHSVSEEVELANHTPFPIKSSVDNLNTLQLSGLASYKLVLDDDCIIDEASSGNKIDNLRDFCFQKSFGDPVYEDGPMIGPSNKPVHVTKVKVKDIEEVGVCIVSKKLSKKVAAYKLLTKLRRMQETLQPGSSTQRHTYSSEGIEAQLSGDLDPVLQEDIPMNDGLEKENESSINRKDLPNLYVEDIFGLDDTQLATEAEKGNKIQDLTKLCTLKSLADPVYSHELVASSNQPLHVVECKVGDISERGTNKNKKISKKIAAYKVLRKLEMSKIPNRKRLQPESSDEESLSSSDGDADELTSEKDPLICKSSENTPRSKDQNILSSTAVSLSYSMKNDSEDKKSEELSTTNTYGGSRTGRKYRRANKSVIPRKTRKYFNTDCARQGPKLETCHAMCTRSQKQFSRFDGQLVQEIIKATKTLQNKTKHPKPLKEMEKWLKNHELGGAENFFRKLQEEMHFTHTILAVRNGINVTNKVEAEVPENLEMELMLTLSIAIPGVEYRVPTVVKFGRTQQEAAEQAYVEMLTYLGGMCCGAK